MIATVLFTDIVGSTERVSELGDRDVIERMGLPEDDRRSSTAP